VSEAPAVLRRIEVFADVRCPFTHVGLHRLVERRRQLGAGGTELWVRSWPLELVNGAPLDPALIAEEVDELRTQVAPELFAGFDPDRFPVSSMPALRVAAAAYARSAVIGERVSLALRRALFEDGRDVSDPTVLAAIASDVGLGGLAEATDDDVVADWREGEQRGVVGSPHFFVADESWFCPALEITRHDGHLQISSDAAAFERFVAACLP
jgi:predicted DsbA family dithiol-disulfide isomerase